MPYPYSYDNEEKNYIPPKLKTNRSMLKLVILSILTLGLYSVVFFIPFSYDLDKVSPRSDRSKTMHYAFAFILSLFTFNIVIWVWHYHIAERVEEALEKRSIPYQFSTGTFWGWYFLGSFIFIGPFVYMHKLCKAMNLLCADYNENPTIIE